MMQAEKRTLNPLRFSYPDVYERLVEMLRLVGLNAYDIIAEAVGPTRSLEVVVRIRYGFHFEHSVEDTFTESQLLAEDSEVTAFLQAAAETCHKQSIADYRGFMGRGKP